MILTRSKIEDFKSERLSDSTSDHKKKGAIKSKKTTVHNSPGSTPKLLTKNKLNETMKSSVCDINDVYDSEAEESEYEDGDEGDLSSELCADPEKDYCIEPDNLYIDCKVFLPGHKPL